MMVIMVMTVMMVIVMVMVTIVIVKLLPMYCPGVASWGPFVME
jgi:hypothetical protein